jgi:hypothetical protein
MDKWFNALRGRMETAPRSWFVILSCRPGDDVHSAARWRMTHVNFLRPALVALIVLAAPAQASLASPSTHPKHRSER